MNDTDVVAFDAFLERNWGIKPPKLPVYDENGNEIKNEPAPEKQEKAAPEVRKVPRTTANSDVKEGAQGQTNQTVKKSIPANNATPGTNNATAKPKQNPGTTETKPTV